MTLIKRVSLLMGLAAAATIGVGLPAFADITETQDINAVLESESEIINIAFDTELDLPAADSQVETVAPDSEEVAVEETEEAPLASEAEADEDIAESIEAVDDAASAETSADLLAEPEAAVPASITEVLESASVEMAPDSDSEWIAQATAPTFQGVSRSYLGVGGNLGIGDNSPLSDFGFAVISKFSFGPRFSVRPSAIIAESGVSFSIPVTYNFNTTEFGGVGFQPYLGVGADIPTNGSVALLLDAGVDVPISPQFTLNATSLFRVTSGFGMGIIVGVGYNFPGLFD
ncbi:MAG: hypothetical protein ICV77_07695 [Cyanobacteria bacterium Co-bin8]|nr:hypothetical protein [Cyanobacteria bacterium Co-bin8]